MHTKEPWTYARIEATPTGSLEPYSPWIDGAGPRLVTVDRSKCIHADDMRRIVACVNACTGYSNEALEQPGGFMQTLGNALDEIKELKQQRDALLAALKQARSDLGAVGCHIGRGRCDAAIAKVKP